MDYVCNPKQVVKYYKLYNGNNHIHNYSIIVYIFVILMITNL